MDHHVSPRAGPRASDPSRRSGPGSRRAVHGELGLGGRARRGEDVRRFVRLHLLVVVGLAIAAGEEVVPVGLGRGARRARGDRPGRPAPVHHHVLHGTRVVTEGRVDDRHQRDVLALAIGEVRGDHDLRAARPDPIAERTRAEPGEDDRVDRSDPHDREHRDDGLDGRRHVDRHPVARARCRARAARTRCVLTSSSSSRYVRRRRPPRSSAAIRATGRRGPARPGDRARSTPGS